MQYQVGKIKSSSFSPNRNQIISVFGLYCFVLGTSVLGFSIYLFLESSGFVNQNLIH